MGIRGWACALILWPVVAGAETPDPLAGWRAWVAEVGATQSAIAILQGDRVVAEAAIGTDLAAPQPVYSISKMITGACVMHLIAQGALSLDATVSETLDLPESPAAAVTISALLTHQSGIGPDATQNVLRVMTRPQSLSDAQVSEEALARPLKGPGVHDYNNENYAILGQILARVTGEARPCKNRVLGMAPGAAASGRGDVAYGGWKVPVIELARFGRSLRYDPNWPMADLGGGAFYGPGVLVRPTEAGANLWHYGGLCLIMQRGGGAALYALSDGVTLAVTYNVCADGAALARLEAEVLVPAALAYGARD